ncbi:MAG: hydroxymethylbilane synthase [Terriglobia bacterium]
MDLSLGSRGSKLALAQAEWVKRCLVELGHVVRIVPIATSGDRMAAAFLIQPDLKGLFIKEIEEALSAGRIDLAVHSLKDVPVDQPPGLRIAAVPRREDARDVLVSRGNAKLDQLAAGSRVGTSSPRRQSQLLRLRPDLAVEPIRGNVDTRLGKLKRGDYDALIMAAAGLRRLGLEDQISEYFSPEQICPAAGQGALAMEIRDADERLARLAAALDDAESHLAVRAEREALRALGGGCRTPIAAYARVDAASLAMHGVVAAPDGRQLICAHASGVASDPEQVGRWLAENLTRDGARELIGL